MKGCGFEGDVARGGFEVVLDIEVIKEVAGVFYIGLIIKNYFSQSH